MTLIKINNVPTMRFPEFSGEWVLTKLVGMGIFTGGGTPDTNIKKYWKGSIPWISSSDLIDGDILNFKITRYITKEAISKSATKVVPANSVMFISRVGVGKLAVNQAAVCTSQDFTNFTPEKGNSLFIGYLFQSKKNLLLRYSQGTSIQGFTTKELKGIKTLHPAIKEQQKIASFLKSVDNKIVQLGKKKSLLEKYKKGMMQKLFSQALRFKDEQGEDLPDWDEKNLGEIAEFKKGKGISKSDITENGKNMCIRYGELYTEYNEVIEEVVSRTDTEKEISILSEKNDVLMPTSDVTPNGLATASALDEHGVILGGDILIIRSKNILNKYFCYYVAANKYEIMRLVSGVTVYHIYGSDMATLRIRIPSHSEQQQIANFLSALDKIIDLVATEIKQAQTFKKGLLQQMFV